MHMKIQDLTLLDSSPSRSAPRKSCEKLDGIPNAPQSIRFFMLARLKNIVVPASALAQPVLAISIVHLI